MAFRAEHGPSRVSAVNMTSTVNLTTTFGERLELLGLPEAQRRTGMRVLREVAVFMGTPAETWQRVDLERFIKLRAPSLRPEDRAAYTMGLGLLTEIIERCLAQKQRLLLEELNLPDPNDSGFESSVTGQFRNLRETSTLSQEGLKSRERRGSDASGAFARLDERDTSPGFTESHSSRVVQTAEAVLNSSVIPIAQVQGDQTDFLRENVERWKRERSHTLQSQEPQALAGRGPTPLRTPLPQRTPANLHDVLVDVAWEPTLRCVHLVWSGFVLGEKLRWMLGRGLEIQRQHGGQDWLMDMRSASVISQDDTGWFGDWMTEIGRHGVRRFAIVSPDHVICRMQLQRFRDHTDVMAVTLPIAERVAISFFDEIKEARQWLSQGRLTRA